MKKQERQLFKALCSFQAENFDESLLQYATPYVLGQLFFNRMQGIAYGNLKKHGLLGCISREFKNSLRDSYMQNLEKNRSYFWSVHYLNELLSEYECN